MAAAILYIVLLWGAVMKTAEASFCGTGALPFRFEVLPNGMPVLGCAIPSCFGDHDQAGRLSSDSQFADGPDGKDGFLREGDLEHNHVRVPNAPPQEAVSVTTLW